MLCRAACVAVLLRRSQVTFEVLFFFPALFYFPASGQAVVTGVVPFPPGSCLQILSRLGFSNPTARRFSSSVAHALAFSASQFERKKKSPRTYTSTCMHLRGFELTKLTHTRLEDNLIRHRGDRLPYQVPVLYQVCTYTTLMNHEKSTHSQPSSAQLRITQQRSAAPCGVVRCVPYPAVQC